MPWPTPNSPPRRQPKPEAVSRVPQRIRSQNSARRADATAADNWNRYLRSVAELENVRKRAARDIEAARRAGVEKLASELLAIADTLEMGLESGATASVT